MEEDQARVEDAVGAQPTRGGEEEGGGPGAVSLEEIEAAEAGEGEWRPGWGQG